MIAKTLDDLLVYQKALKASDAVSALLKRPAFQKDCELRDQLSRSSGRVPPLIAEGFGQETDRHFAHYLGIARGSAQETRAHLAVAHGRNYISSEELSGRSGEYHEIAKMLTPWIVYLRKCDRKQRG
jgi:four helix bundle protein